MPDTSLKLADLLPSWLVNLQSQNLSPNTVKHYAQGVRAFLAWCESTDTTPELSRANMSAFLADLLAGGAEPNTAKARYQALRRFSKWLADEGEISSDELLGTSPPRLDAKVVDPLTTDELQRLIKACQGRDFRDRRDEAIVRLMAETAMRAGECAALTLADINIARGMATVRRGKGGRGRIVPFGPQTAAAVDRYIRQRRTHRLAATPALWLGTRSRAFNYMGLHRTLAMRARMAGIERFHPHLLRHTAATRWLAAEGSEGGLMAVAGWRRRDMLDRYVAATAAERAAEEAKRLNLGEF